MDKTYLGRSIEDFAPGIESKPITKVELLDENGDIVGVAGNDSGKTLTAQNPDGTNEMAQAILAKVSGYTHIGYEGQNAMLDPAAEIGDAVTVSGHYVPIISTDSIFDSLLAVNISAPDSDELDDEYPYKSKTQRQIERNMAVTRSLITKSANEIALRIDGVEGDVSSLQVSLGNVQSEVSGKIDGNDAQTLIEQTLEGISLSVSGTNGSTTFAIKQGSTTLDSTTFDLHVKAVNITGTLTASQIQTSSIYVGDLADGSSYATKTYVQNNAGLSASEVDDAIATYIDETSITAESLRGRTVDLLASATRSIGSIELVYTSTGYGMSINTAYGGVQISSGGNVYITSRYNTRIQLDEDAAKLGPSVWATNGTVIYDSDRNVKNSIDYDLSRYRQFLLDLKPCRFKYNEGQSGRYHIGMIAQDVEQSLYDNGIDSTEFSGWCKAPIRDENHNITGYTYGIRYDSLIPLNTLMIQELVKRVEALEKRSWF